MIRRREFITLLGGAAVTWPVAVRAQQGERMRRIVFLHGIAENDPEAQARVVAFQQGLEAFGWVENRNTQVEHRFSGGDFAQMQTYTAKVVDSSPDLIVASSSPVIAALKQATHTIPIVFSVVNDPLGQGFVANQARPGGRRLPYDREMAGATERDRPRRQPDHALVQSPDRCLLPLLPARIWSGRGIAHRRDVCNTGARRDRNRGGRRSAGAGARWRFHCRAGPLPQCPSRGGHGDVDAASAPGDFWFSAVRDGRRIDVVRA